jgi:hypothetical protein
MKKYYKIIYSKKIRTDKGDIYKYNLISKFFNTGIKDFYFSEVNKNKFKGWKYKENKDTVLILLEGKVKFYFKDKKKNYKTLILNSKTKNILLIKKKIYFKFKNLFFRKSIFISFLNEKY